MQRNTTPFLATLLALALSACAATPTESDTPVSSDAASSQANSGLQTQGAQNRGSAGDAQALQAQRDAELRRQTVIYFDFDSSEYGKQYDAMLDAHARYLVSNPAARLRLEGHTDERGTREYNIGLGERRSLTVRRALLLRGATKLQLTTTSYGEEKPAALGAGESAWQRNRRVELSYQ